jgi:PAS domain S-box-containing protein
VVESNNSGALQYAVDSIISRYLGGESSVKICSAILDLAIKETGSEYGFIADVQNLKTKPYLRIRAWTDISWDEETRKRYTPEGAVFSNMDSIFGQGVKAQGIYISNDCPNDPNRCGLPPGHPPLNSFISVPIIFHEEMIGVIALANSPDGYRSDAITKKIGIAAALVLSGLQNEKSSHSQLALLENLTNCIDEAIVSMTEDGTVIRVNKGFLKLFGYEHEGQILGKPMTVIMPGKYRHGHDKGLKKYLRTNQATHVGKAAIPLEGRHKDGHNINITLAIHEVYADGSRIFNGVMQADVSKQDVSGENIDSMLNLLNVPVLEFDSKGNICKWNKYMNKLTGMSNEEAYGKSLLDIGLISETNFKKQMAVMSGTLDGAKVTDVECIFIDKDKNERTFTFDCSPKVTTEGITGLYAAGVDRTDYVEQINMVTQSQKMAVFGQLAGGIAHDFGNLLQVISGNLEYIKGNENGLDPLAIEALDDTISAADQGVDLTAQLLQFAKKRRDIPSAIDLNEKVNNLESFLKSAVGDDCDLEIIVPDEPVHVAVDESPLATALLNLCLNAKDASPTQGRIEITVEKSTSHSVVKGKNAEMILLSVRDYGAGMTHQEIQSAMTPFYTTKGNGTGLGLAMVQNFVDQNNGSFRIQSKKGRGTTMVMSFPLVESVAAPAVSDETNAIATKIAEKDWSAETILLVEDDFRVARFAQRCFEEQGFRIFSAANAEEAMDILLKEKSITCMLTDVRMPGKLNGRDLANWSNNRFPKLKIMITTGYDEDRSIIKQTYPILQKPYSILELRSFVSQVLLEDIA